jgi:hypothetical protein
MVRITFGLVLALVFALPLLAAENAVEESWQTYIDHTYKVTLRFPGEWSRDPLIYQDRPYFSSERKPHSVIHNFQILVMGDEDTTPEQACKGEVEHVLRPFGAKPTIQLNEIDGRSACLVFPSDDVGAPWYAAAFIKYPEPIEIEGDRYSILALYADKDYFRGIIGSLHFISPARSNPPFLLTIASAQVGKSGATWKNDAAFPLLLTMKNSSEKVLHVALADPASDYRVVTMHKTERVRVTQNLPAVDEQSQGATAPTRNVAKILKPTETCQDAIEIKFWADREAPGEYTLQVERDLPHELGKGLVESNTITVVVIN